jgi:hypothetical protein
VNEDEDGQSEQGDQKFKLDQTRVPEEEMNYRRNEYL